jgi:hypothetical protein
MTDTPRIQRTLKEEVKAPNVLYAIFIETLQGKPKE